MTTYSSNNNNVKSTIKYYAGAAAAIGASPIPCSDAVLLTGVQTKMMYDIMKAYGINVGVGMVIEEILKAKVVSMLGKMVAGNIIKCIPFVGSWGGAAINASVASSITYTLGRGLCAAAEMITDNGWKNDSDMVAYAVRCSI